MSMHIDEEDVEIMTWEGEGGSTGLYYHRHTEMEEDEEPSTAQKAETALSDAILYLEQTINAFAVDPADSDYQRGYLAALTEMLNVLAPDVADEMQDDIEVEIGENDDEG